MQSVPCCLDLSKTERQQFPCDFLIRATVDRIYDNPEPESFLSFPSLSPFERVCPKNSLPLEVADQHQLSLAPLKSLARRCPRPPDVPPN